MVKESLTHNCKLEIQCRDDNYPKVVSYIIYYYKCEYKFVCYAFKLKLINQTSLKFVQIFLEVCIRSTLEEKENNKLKNRNLYG